MNKSNLIKIDLLTTLLSPDFIRNYYGSDSYDTILASMNLPPSVENINDLKRSIIHTQYLLLNMREIDEKQTYLEDDNKDIIVTLSNIDVIYTRMLDVKTKLVSNKPDDIASIKESMEFVAALYNNKYFIKVNEKEKFGFKFDKIDVVKDPAGANGLIKDFLDQVLDFIQANRDEMEAELNTYLDKAIKAADQKLAATKDIK